MKENNLAKKNGIGLLRSEPTQHSLKTGTFYAMAPVSPESTYKCLTTGVRLM